MQGDDEGRMNALAQEALGSAAPDSQMSVDRHPEEALRQTGLWIETGLQIEQRPADVMLLCPERDLLARVEGPEALVTPRPCQLTGKPCVRELTDGERAVVVDS